MKNVIHFSPDHLPKDVRKKFSSFPKLQVGETFNLEGIEYQYIGKDSNGKIAALKEETRGGYRENAGRKKSDIETTTLSFRVPEYCSIELKVLIQTTIAKFLKKKNNQNCL